MISPPHAPAALLLGKNARADWTGEWVAAEPVWTVCRRQKLLASAGIRIPSHPACSLVTTLTELLVRIKYNRAIDGLDCKRCWQRVFVCSQCYSILTIVPEANLLLSPVLRQLSPSSGTQTLKQIPGLYLDEAVSHSFSVLPGFSFTLYRNTDAYNVRWTHCRKSLRGQQPCYC
jgi:hypothetical protein